MTARPRSAPRRTLARAAALMPSGVRRRVSDPEALPMHCTYRDGREIPEADLEHVREVIWRNLVAFPWQQGDVVAIDNFSMSHGRLPYRGPRQVVVAWA